MSVLTEPQTSGAEALIRLTRVRELLNLTNKQLSLLMEEVGIKFQKTPGTGQRAITQTEYRMVSDRAQAHEQARATQPIPTLPPEAFKVNVDDPTVSVSASETAELYIGPTNSGKTYHALEALTRSWEQNPTLLHAYAAPLRLLAYEVYQKLSAIHGEQNVGFITGEEQINPTAPILACTVEMTPKDGHLLVLDEAHWLTDPSRGHYWTRHIRNGRWTHQHLLTAAEAVPTIKKLLHHAGSITEHTFTRRTPIKFGGMVSLANVPKKSAIVAFSRRHVYTLAVALKNEGYKPGVLYGRLPLAVRKRQIAKFIAGDYDVIVCTDVIGHGINLPLDNVIFAGATKFDGHKSRNLHIWETAQIAGRAGRYGFSDHGTVYGLTDADMSPEDLDLLKTGVLAAAGLAPTDLQADLAVEAPQLEELLLYPEGGIAKASLLPAKLETWVKVATEQYPAPYRPNPMHIQHALLVASLRAVGGSPNPAEDGFPQLHAPSGTFTVQDAWQMSQGPFDPNGLTIARIAQWRASSHPETSPILGRYFRDHVLQPLHYHEHLNRDELPDALEALEQAYAVASELKMAVVMFSEDESTLGTLTITQLLEAEEKLNELIWESISRGQQSGKTNRCGDCGSRLPLLSKRPYCRDCGQDRKYKKF